MDSEILGAVIVCIVGAFLTRLIAFARGWTAPRF